MIVYVTNKKNKKNLKKRSFRNFMGLKRDIKLNVICIAMIAYTLKSTPEATNTKQKAAGPKQRPREML